MVLGYTSVHCRLCEAVFLVSIISFSSGSIIYKCFLSPISRGWHYNAVAISTAHLVDKVSTYSPIRHAGIERVIQVGSDLRLDLISAVRPKNAASLSSSHTLASWTACYSPNVTPLIMIDIFNILFHQPMTVLVSVS